MGVFDVTARRAAKREGVGFFRWVLPRLAPALAFTTWLDARTAPRLPETELTCDALAEFNDPSRPELPWIFVTEFQTEPGEDDLDRLLEYTVRFRRERRPTSDSRLKFQVGGVMLNLTGPHQPDALAMALPGMPDYGLTARVVRLAVREEDASAILARISSGELSRCVRPWVALMRGGGEAAVIQEWKRLADLEAEERVRLEYAAEALVFAELPGVQREWKLALEGWNMRVSQQVLEWQAVTQRANLLSVLENHCQAAVPKDLVETIEATEDMQLLSRWFKAALKARTFDDFRASMQAQP
jgi:hypothetical protein